MKRVAIACGMGLALASPLGMAAANPPIDETVPADEAHEAARDHPLPADAGSTVAGEAIVQGSANEESDCD